MSFGNWLGNHSDTEPVLMLAIGSATITATIIKPAAPKPEILYLTRESFGFSQQTSAEQLTKSMIAALMAVLMRVQSEGREAAELRGARAVRIKRVECTLSPPWYRGQTHVVCIQKKKPVAITERLIADIIEEETTRAQSVPADAESPSQTSSETKLMDARVLRTRLNGYLAKAPNGTSAREIELAIYYSFFSSALHSKILEVIDKVFHTDEVRFHASALVGFAVLRKLFHGVDHALIIEMTGELTEVSLVRDNILQATGTFPTGSNHLIRAVMNDRTMSSAEAASRIKLYMRERDDKHSGEHQRTSEAVEWACRRFTHALGETVTEISEGAPLPSSVYVLAEHGWEIWCSRSIKREALSPLTYSDKPFSVLPLDKRILGSRCIFSKGVPFHTYAALNALMYTYDSRTPL